MDYIGMCPYCGQTCQLTGNFANEEEKREAAAESCTCQEAVEARKNRERRKRQIEQANHSIVTCFEYTEGGGFSPLAEEVADQAVALLRASVEPVVDGLLEKVTIVMSGVRGTIARGGGGKITVERTDTIKRKEES